MWYDNPSVGDSWQCSCCGTVKEGIIAASKHWTECGGKDTYQAIKNVFDNPSSTFDNLKEVLDSENPNPELH